MAKVVVGKSLKDTDVLWRYMSLDKFIDLVESHALYFAPLSTYGETDPFEGYMPKAATQALADISRKYRDQHLEAIEKLERELSGKVPQEIRHRLKADLQKLRVQAESHVPTMGALAKNISACTMVNCWFKGEHESEGMWNLYARNGVAVKTSVRSMRHALSNDDDQPVVHVGSVKYVDFSNPDLKPGDCVTEDGHLMGMIKRVAYEHEKEVRMYVARMRPSNCLDLLQPEPMRVSADVQAMIEAVVVSPFAGITIERSVRAVCRWSGINEGIVSRSNLLDNCEYLLDAYK
ncbi:DUF2971 domain-containing protein [Pandoraea terrigena]|uniref:DUF2971 domain-containing protein n=1 Tax=Pandoraea terrigena TaxID=2508292 RepID=A0A5E4TR38_9BURK|nr:DUF2971 domain-containing protein [Pandoraea terrigena]VVD89613.1 hypothetical protein PTE31013_01560 [Pandoraea terrigena]